MHTDADVPNWNRSKGFSYDKKAWWQWSGLPVMSMACSLFAMALVIFNVQFTVQEGAMTVSFAGNKSVNQTADIESMIDNKLQRFASEQQVVLANYAADIKVKQQDNNLQLASYVLTASRKERKEDIGEFIQYVNEQRADEQFTNKLKFKQLEQALFYDNAGTNTLESMPTNWVTEE